MIGAKWSKRALSIVLPEPLLLSETKLQFLHFILPESLSSLPDFSLYVRKEVWELAKWEVRGGREEERGKMAQR